MARSLLSDLRVGFSLAVLGLGLTTAALTDFTLRHAMQIESGHVLHSEGLRILQKLEDQAKSPGQAVPESTQVDWWLLSPEGHRIAGSAGAAYLKSVPWNSVGPEPSDFRVEDHLYSAIALPSSLGVLWVAMDRTPEIQIVDHFRRDLTVIVLAISFLAGGLGHLIAKRGLRPLRLIRDETARIEAQDLHRRLDAARFPEELADLVAALNGALGRLEDAFTRLEAFSTDLAHELRTPLQNLRAELEGRVLRPKAEVNLPEILGSLLEELDRLDDMVEQILFLARSTVPGTAVNRQVILAGDLLRETTAFFGASAEEAGVELVIAASPDQQVRADPRLLRRALQNLIANALRHTPSGGRILLSASKVEDAEEIAVSDDGEGIPAELLPRLGDRFLRVDQGRGRATGGAGLGLAIVKGIMELHGGSFAVESRSGTGTTVRLRFPLRA